MTIFQDWKANSGRPQIQLLLLLFRFAQKVRASNPILKFIMIVPSTLVYRGYSLFFCGVDIPVSTEIGAKFQIHHGQSLVIHNLSVIGPNCTLRQSVTIGVSKSGEGAPILVGENNIGAGAIIIGEITVGRGSTVGAGAVVTKDVPDLATVVGNPAKAIKSGPSLGAIPE